MKKLIVSVLSACVLCPTIASAETFTLACTFNKEATIVRMGRPASDVKVETISINQSPSLIYKIERDQYGKFRAWSTKGDEQIVSLTKYEESKDAVFLRISAPKKDGETEGFVDVVTGYTKTPDVNGAVATSTHFTKEDGLMLFIEKGFCAAVKVQ